MSKRLPQALALNPAERSLIIHALAASVGASTQNSMDCGISLRTFVELSEKYPTDLENVLLKLKVLAEVDGD
jgi:hypothetical protein